MHRINWARHCSSSPRKWKISNSNFIEPFVYKLERWNNLQTTIFVTKFDIFGSWGSFRYNRHFNVICYKIKVLEVSTLHFHQYNDSKCSKSFRTGGARLPSGNFTKLIDKFKTLRTLKVTFLNAANYNELDPKRSGRPCTLQFLCLCDDIDEIPSKILETIESFAISICNGKKYAHSYCSGELELLKMNETDL